MQAAITWLALPHQTTYVIGAPKASAVEAPENPVCLAALVSGAAHAFARLVGFHG